MKRITNTRFAACAALALGSALFTSCITPMYRPSAMNAPLLSAPGELQLRGGYGEGGMELQGAYAVNTNIAVVAEGHSTRFTDPQTASARSIYEGGDLGAGIYLPQLKYLRADLLAGVGLGQTRKTDDNRGKFVVGDYQRGWLQMNVGIGTFHGPEGNRLEACLYGAGRLSYQHYSTYLHFEQGFGSIMTTPLQPSNTLDNPWVALADVQLGLRLGFKEVQLYAQMGSSTVMSSEVAEALEWSQFSVGASVRLFPQRYKAPVKPGGL